MHRLRWTQYGLEKLFAIGHLLVAFSMMDHVQGQALVTNEVNMLPQKLVIAHRGTTYWAPEETEAAMRWARNTGADYLEFDLQRTKDGYLIALHDNNLLRTTDVAFQFPNRQNEPLSNFTYAELLTLDAGEWFNKAYPDRARKGFRGLDILTLEDVVRIAEGYRIRRTQDGKRIWHTTSTGAIATLYEVDPCDNGHRPGIYIETKVPQLFPGIEKDLKRELERLQWYQQDIRKLKYIPIVSGKVGIANSIQRVVLQTFSKESLIRLQNVFERSLPTCFLLWRGADPDDLPDDSLPTFEEWVVFGKAHGATIIGPSISGEPNNYNDLLTSAHAQLIRKAGLQIHAYSFDTKAQLDRYGPWVDGMFSNKAEEALLYFQQHTTLASRTLDLLGY